MAVTRKSYAAQDLVKQGSMAKYSLVLVYMTILESEVLHSHILTKHLTVS
jgi:hypothetical protein